MMYRSLLSFQRAANSSHELNWDFCATVSKTGDEIFIPQLQCDMKAYQFFHAVLAFQCFEQTYSIKVINLMSEKLFWKIFVDQPA